LKISKLFTIELSANSDADNLLFPNKNKATTKEEIKDNDWLERVSEGKADSFSNSLLDDEKSFNNNNHIDNSYSNLNTTDNNQRRNLNSSCSKLLSLKESIVSNLKSIKKNRGEDKNNTTVNDSQIINENNFSKLSNYTSKKSEKQKIEDYFRSIFQLN